MFGRVSDHLHSRSTALLRTLEQSLHKIFLGWLAFAAVACAIRLLTARAPLAEAVETTLWTYALLLVAPIGTALLALGWFAGGGAQPRFRLARAGRWREVGPDEARRHPLYGTSGIMVSLLMGMLLNVVFRTGEYLLAIPPITSGAPDWVQGLQLAMAADAVILSSLYVVAFVMALRRHPLFPRFLLLVWMADLLMQLVIAQVVGSYAALPPAAGAAVHALLFGAVQKVLISMTIWSPYLLLSRRVNVTYRLRVPA